MHNNKTIIISKQFYPVKGGVETFLLEVAMTWNSKDIEVWCQKHDEVPNRMENPVLIKRFSWGNGTFKNLCFLLKNAFNASNKLLYCYFCLLFFLNRNVVKNCLPFIIESYAEMLSKLKKDKKPLVIQCSMPVYTGIIGLFYKLVFNVPLVVYAHGSELIYYSRRSNQKLIQQFVLKKADLLISNSQFTTDLLVSKGAERNKIYKTLLGANTRMFYPKETQSLIKKKYNIPNNHKIILTVSHLVPRKGADMVLKALPKILKEIPDLTYLIGGRGEYLNTLKGLVEKLQLENHVIFLGFIKDEEINDLFNACDVFIMPNRQQDYDVEGFGIVFADAAACAKATIAGNSGGAVDAIVDKKTGFLVNPLSIEDISEKCIELLSDEGLRHRFGQNGYQRVKDELNWDSVRENIFSQIYKLTEKKDGK
ncbi:MAG TPA: glycosyltransferase family 4 protein [Candidatus Cloacimonadota bacterium]|nr:glycosyltransferase family 4 protein [Candidatus Cloacimonadota bacterium]HPM03537.1 glycosyltransferase family 4 protein [Candidatus Cloacimonadota bacterium]